jgi:hypothetical protein
MKTDTAGAQRIFAWTCVGVHAWKFAVALVGLQRTEKAVPWANPENGMVGMTAVGSVAAHANDVVNRGTDGLVEHPSPPTIMALTVAGIGTPTLAVGLPATFHAGS